MCGVVHTFRTTFLLILFSLFHTIILGASIALGGTNGATHHNFTLPDICPLGEPLRSVQGLVIACNCPPHPFCPMLYYCKIAIYGKPGICCPDFGADNRHLIKPEDSRISAIKGQRSSKKSCEVAPCETSKPSPSATNQRERVEVVSTTAKPLETFGKQSSPRNSLKDQRPRCTPVNAVDIQPLPSPKCKYEDVMPDAFGCALPPRVVCPRSNDCPPFPMSIIPPNCVLGREKYDRNGCPIMPDLICYNQSTPLGPVNSPKAVPQAPAFRPKKSNNRKKVTPVMKRPIRTPKPTTQAPSPPPCPVYLLPPTLSPDCVVAPSKKDARGCYLPPEIVCEKRPTSYAETDDKMPDFGSEDRLIIDEEPVRPKEIKCPKITAPFVQPGCKLLDPKYDDKGCMVMREIVCDTTIISKMCPHLELPQMDPMCTFGPERNDSNGCPTVPEILCPTTVDLGFDTTEPVTESVTVMEKKEPRIMSHCPYVPPPYLPPGCSYGTAKYDDHGCSLAPDVTCKHEGEDDNHIIDIPPPRLIPDDHHFQSLTSPPPMTTSTTEVTPVTYKRSFRDMLTSEFYHTVQSNVSPDAATFRRSVAVAAVTAGRFYGCRLHADCFHLREPREWCDTGSPESDAQWTDKSCHCSEDTIVPACIVERSNRGFLEWTFCADYSQCAIKNN